MPTITTDDQVELYYEVAGDGQPLLLLSGFAADRTFWTGLLPALVRRHTVVTMDGRGVGRSSVPDVRYQTDQLAEDVLAVLQAAEIGSAHVVGHSLGSAVAQQLAHAHREAVRSLVLFNPFLRASTPVRLALSAAAHFYDTDPAPIANLAEALFPWLFSRRFLETGDNLATMLRLSLQNPYPQPRAGYVRQLEALLGFDSAAWIGDVDTPTLIVAAERDLLTPPEDAAALAEQIPGAELVVVPGSGHAAPVERPELCAALVLGHLQHRS